MKQILAKVIQPLVIFLIISISTYPDVLRLIVIIQLKT